MPNSLRARLKNLVHKGLLSQKDLDRILIVLVDGTGDLISRQTLKDLGAECIARRDENGNLIPLGSIDSLPSVSTEKTGRWKYQKFEGWECMNCGYIVPLYLAPFEYCPKCGCQMIEMMEGVEE